MAQEGDDLGKGANGDERGTPSAAAAAAHSLAHTRSRLPRSIALEYRETKGPRARRGRRGGERKKLSVSASPPPPTAEVTRTGDVQSWLNIPTEFLPNEQWPGHSHGPQNGWNFPTRTWKTDAVLYFMLRMVRVRLKSNEGPVL